MNEKLNVLFCHRIEYKIITEKVKSHLKNHDKINLIVVDKQNDLKYLNQIIKEIDFDIFFHRNEHCELNTCPNIKKVIDFCYEKNKMPAYFDFGYFDHYNNLIFDFYLPNYKSSIQKIFTQLPDSEIKLHEPILKYIKNFKKTIDTLDYSTEWNKLNLIEKNFIVIWAQYDTHLIKSNFKKNKTINNCEWIIDICREIKNKNMTPVVKISPCDINYDIDLIKKEALVLTSRKDQAKKYNIQFINNINLYLNKYAHSHIIGCSSISNELVLNNSKITTMGRSWFNDLDIFHEPKQWQDILNYKKPDIKNKNRWINWWNLKQFPTENIGEKIIETYYNYINM